GAVGGGVPDDYQRPARPGKARAPEDGRQQAPQVGPRRRFLARGRRLGHDEQSVAAAARELLAQAVFAPGGIGVRVITVDVNDDAGRAAVVAGGPEDVDGATASPQALVN